MKAICIDNKNTERNPFYKDIVDGQPLNEPTLTIGKVYNIDTNGLHARVECDLGYHIVYHTNRFVTIDKWREMQISNVFCQ